MRIETVSIVNKIINNVLDALKVTDSMLGNARDVLISIALGVQKIGISAKNVFLEMGLICLTINANFVQLKIAMNAKIIRRFVSNVWTNMACHTIKVLAKDAKMNTACGVETPISFVPDARRAGVYQVQILVGHALLRIALIVA